MSCNCGGCISRQLLCIGLNNNKSFLFSVLDENGDEVDISAASEILFTVSDGVIIGSNLEAGGTVRFEKRLSDGDIIVAGTGYQFMVDITPADTELPVKSDSYWDVTVTTSSGNTYTVKAGIFRVTKTNAGI
jgi:hypothetical protein